MYQIKFLESIQSVSSKEWNQLLPTYSPLESSNSPSPSGGELFLKHEFLSLLESSASVGASTGWAAHHLTVYRDNQLVAAMPLYIKTHSYGEYVFDWSWARAYQDHHLNYYPKLVTSIPFTPCTGPRQLVLADEDKIAITHFMTEAIITHCKAMGYSSWHSLFCSPEEADSILFSQPDLLQRIDVQFHWHNRDYKSWDDFVAQLQSRKRKNILKERSAVSTQGFQFIYKSGRDISNLDLENFYQFYVQTYLKRSGHNGYLTREFFAGLADCFNEHLLLIEAYIDNRQVAAALYFQDRETLYGRYWGSNENFDFLHFETCYYQGIDYAIAKGLKRFDGGAQGEHKIARGFEPQITRSIHWIERPDFRVAITRFLNQERLAVQNYFDQVESHTPFKKNN